VWGLAGARAVLGDLPGADAELAEVIADAGAAGDPLCRFNGLTTHSFILGWQGKTTAARVAAEVAIESAADLGVLIEGQGYLTLGAAELAAGDVGAAKDALTQGWNRIADIEFSTMNTRWRSETELAAGDLAAARSWAEQAVSATRGFFRMLALTARARVALAEEDAEAAVRDAYDALAAAAHTGAQLGVPDVFDFLARLAAHAGSYPEAARLVGAAQAVREHTGEVPYEIYRADYQALLAALRDAMGQNDFDTARAEGARLSTAEAIAYAQRGRGERKRPSTGWGSLTPTERNVVRLVSEGLSNKDIAAKLFVSPRTIDTHLTHVYTKLDLSSRVQLAQEATRRTDDRPPGPS
jgi:DNA-binding CsgD family transcriptional regulator